MIRSWLPSVSALFLIFCLGDFHSESSEIPEATQSDLAKWLTTLKEGDPAMRMEAAKLLGEKKFKEALPALLKALHDTDQHVRTVAAEALGVLEEREAVPGLMEALKDEYVWVRIKAIESLHLLGSSNAAILALIREIQHPDRYNQLQATDLAIEMQAKQAIPALIQAYEEDEDYWQQAQRDPEFVAEFGEDHEEIDLRVRILYAFRVLKAKEAIPLMKKALKHDYYWMRANALDALGTIGDSDTVSDVLPMLKDHESMVRSAAAKALGQMKATEAIPQLKQALSDEDESVRQDVAEALQSLNSAE